MLGSQDKKKKQKLKKEPSGLEAHWVFWEPVMGSQESLNSSEESQFSHQLGESLSLSLSPNFFNKKVKKKNL